MLFFPAGITSKAEALYYLMGAFGPMAEGLANGTTTIDKVRQRLADAMADLADLQAKTPAFGPGSDRGE
jgi:hypothetical protein